MSYQGKLLGIIQIGDPVLLQRAQEIDEIAIQSPGIQELIEDMKVTMYAAPGIGLAAPQVSQSLRIIVFYLPASRDDSQEGAGVPFTVIINPIIEKIGNEFVDDWEGCLSVAGKRGKVARHKKIKYSGYDEKGVWFERQAEGWHARLVQHECDHLDGILYPELIQKEDEFLDVEAWKALNQK